MARSWFLIAVLALAGCGGTSAVSTAAATTTTFPAEYSAPYDVAATSPGADDTHLVVRLVPLGVAGQINDCPVRAEIQQLDEADAGIVRLNFTLTARQVEADGCPEPWIDVPVALHASVKDRRVTISTGIGGGWWLPTGSSYEKCQLPKCNPDTGAPQPAPTCDNGTLSDAVRRGDVPQHVVFKQVRCEGEWAVIDLDFGAAACGPVSEIEGSNRCANQQVHRQYFRAEGNLWKLIAWDEQAGCTAIHATTPEFPDHLCADLPALP